MAIRPEGQVVERRSKSGRGYAIRFNAYGRWRYVTLGRQIDGWSRRRAEVELTKSSQMLFFGRSLVFLTTVDH